MKKLLSLFSGCGGMDLGFEGNFKILRKSYNPKLHSDWKIKDYNDDFILLPRTQFETTYANDILDTAKRAWTPFFEKRKSGKFIHASIVDLVKNGEIEKLKRNKIDIITGGFPCQDFSVSGMRKGLKSGKDHLNKNIINNDDTPSIETRGMLYYWMREVINIIQPKVFIAENVKGLKSMPEVVQTIKNDFENTGDEGYFVVEPKVINASNFGVPQNRERIFFFGFNKKYMKKRAIQIFKKGFLPDELNPFPKPTHISSNNLDLFNENDNLMKLVTVGDALVNLNEPENEKFDLSQKAYSKAKYYHGYQGNIEVKLDKPGPTIRAEHHGNIEFRRLSKKNSGVYSTELKSGLKERRLTVRECARIQTFPDDYEFVRPDKKDKYPLSASSSYKLIGNAVPPLLGFHIAKRLENIWNNIFLK